MGNIFDDVAAQGQPQPVNAPVSPPTSTPTAAPAAPTSGNIFDSVAAEQAQNPSAKTQGAGPSNAETASIVLGGGPQAGFEKGVAETAHTVGALAGKVMPNSWRDALGLPSSFKEPDYLQSTNGVETAGKVAENVA